MKKGSKIVPRGQGTQKAGRHPGQPRQPGVVQAKSAVTAWGKQPPAMPRVSRPRSAPNVLQGKMTAPRQAVNPSKRPPVAPPVYRPQPAPQVLQPKAAGGQQPHADKP